MRLTYFLFCLFLITNVTYGLNVTEYCNNMCYNNIFQPCLKKGNADQRCYSPLVECEIGCVNSYIQNNNTIFLSGSSNLSIGFNYYISLILVFCIYLFSN